MNVLRVLVFVWAGWAACANAAPPCEVPHKVVFAGLDYDSNAFHTAVAQRIVRDGFGCAVDTIPGSTIPLINGMARGDVQVIMEVWKSNTPPSWTEGVANGTLVEVGVNFPDAVQGWFVPRYLVQGAEGAGAGPEVGGRPAEVQGAVPRPRGAGAAAVS